MNLANIDRVTLQHVWPLWHVDTDRPHTWSTLVKVYMDPVALAPYLAIRVNSEKLSKDGQGNAIGAQLAALDLSRQLRQDLKILWRTSAEAGPGAPTWHDAFASAILQHRVFPAGTVPDSLKYLADLIHPYLCGKSFKYRFPNPEKPGKMTTEPCSVKWDEMNLTQYVFMPDGQVFDLKGNLLGRLKRDPMEGK